MKMFNKLFSIFSFILFLIIGLTLSAPFSSADQFPYGNYKDSCKKIIVIGHMLEAKCRARDGSWQHSILYYKPCSGPIRNDNGSLTCDQTPQWLPPGNYKETCRGINVEGNRLWAECRKEDGGWRESSINYNNCYSDLANQNGRLVCGRRHHHNYLPDGNYKETCRNMMVNDDVLNAECRKRNGEWRNTSIDFGDCYGNIVNDNGRLVCQ